MAKPKRILRKNFTEQRVELDGFDFEDCTFIRCILVYSGGDRFTFVGGRFPGSQFRFEGAAERTLTTLRCLKQFGFADVADQLVASIDVPFVGGKAN